MTRMLGLALKIILLGAGGMAYGAGLTIVDVPLFLSGNVAPLNMLIVGRDHKLFYEAYADHSDLDGDGTLDVGYRGLETKPDPADPNDTVFKIDYFGYFDPYICYEYSVSTTMFIPASNSPNKRCSGQWSGDWLNYMTTTRIDALRKVLYGGKRVVDDVAETVLERATIPQDAHSWGKEYTSTAVDGYNISDVTPLPQPAADTKHFFANTTLLTTTSWTTNNERPRFRILRDQPSPRRIWHWVSKEAPVAGGSMDTGSGKFPVTVAATDDMVVRVQVCSSTTLEEKDSCRAYGDHKKPTGLLQDFGENDSMLFGLITGSYQKSKSGGVVRKDVGSMKNEILWETTGEFVDPLPANSIIRTLDSLQAAGFTNYTGDAGGYGAAYPGGLVSHRPFSDGEHGGNWGNPIAEMMYEGLRYFAQRGNAGDTSRVPTTAYNFAGGIDATAPLSLSKVDAWANPYASTKPACAKPFETVLSDVNTSYDSNQLPGTFFGGGIASDLPGSLNVANLGNSIWTNEIGGTAKYFIGESYIDATTGIANGAPTPKDVNSFGRIRGQSPEEPTKQGSYYAASVAYHGLTTDLNTVAGQQKAQTFAVALASPLPRIEIPVNGRTVTIIPFAKSVGGCGSDDGNPADGNFTNFQPTNQIVDFYIETIAADRRSGTFQVNFEDVEAGNDHDMDAIARYDYRVNADNTVEIKVSSDYAQGCIIQHLGYVISGTAHDGIYLVVRDRDTAQGSDPDYFLDTPPAFDNTTTNPPAPASGTGTYNDATYLPLESTRTFTVGPTDAADVLHDPLWYAAKWGGFKDENGNNLPDRASEWDENSDGVPDNYYLVTNALTLGDRLGEAFLEIGRRTGSASSASVNTGSISSETRVYQAKFNSGDWTGQLLSFPVITVDDPDTTTVNEVGTLAPAEWTAWEQMNTQDWDTDRVIITNANGAGAIMGGASPFRWDDLSTANQNLLQPNDSGTLRGEERLEYLRGDDSLEQRNGYFFRNRQSPDPTDTVAPIAMLPNKLGDIISSSPIFVGAPPFGYRDSIESVPYSTFAAANANRPKMVYVGANDGMVHGFDAGTGPTMGQEKLAYIPQGVFKNLHELTKPNYPYNHKFFVDGTPTMGDVFFGGAWHTMLVGGLNKGGQSIYALDITDPTTFTEANAGSIFRWEYSDADLGYTYSRPAIAKMANGRWAAIFGNGYNNSLDPVPKSSTGRAYLYIVDIEDPTATGAVVKIDTMVGDTATPNGLATPAVVDVNGDSVADYVYAGDLRGNMWKFDLRDPSSANWNVAFSDIGVPAPLYRAVDPSGVGQPITSKPEVGRGPRGQGVVVLFGTGKFMESADKSPTQTQTFYGILDPNTGAPADRVTGGRTNLTAQTIIFEGTRSFGGIDVPVRATTSTPLAAAARGWYMDLLSPVNIFRGEMQVSNSALRAGRVIFTTLIPDSDPCGFGGSSWLMEMDAVSGARLSDPPFDLNNDGLFTSADQFTVTIAGVDVTVSPSGQQSSVGIAQGPGILFDPGTGSGGGKEYKYLSGSTANASGSNLQRIVENPGPNSTGRQSWRQIK